MTMLHTVSRALRSRAWLAGLVLFSLLVLGPSQTARTHDGVTAGQWMVKTGVQLTPRPSGAS